MTESSWLNKEIGRMGGLPVENYDVPGESVLLLAKKLGKAFEETAKLDANENFMLPRDLVMSKLRELSKFLDTRLYPLDQQLRLFEALEGYTGAHRSRIVIGNGSDELLELLSRVFLKRGTSAISISPTFSMYKVITQTLGREFIEVPLGPGFELDVGDILSACEKSTHVCFICSPNNPTGNQFPLEQVESLAREFNGLLVVDEAYVEFAEHSLVERIGQLNNVIILRTFSKAFGLAGLRIGYAVTSPKVASILKRFQLPYNVNSVSLEMALLMLHNLDQVKTGIEKVKTERTRLIKSMTSIPHVVPYSSEANFIFLKTTRLSARVRDALAEKAILVRCFDSLELKHHLRMTIGTKEMNERFLKTLREIALV